jgi:hypothetical protein
VRQIGFEAKFDIITCNIILGHLNWNGVKTPGFDLFMFLRLKPEVIEKEVQ